MNKVSTSKLQRHTGEQLRHRFAKYGIAENTRPAWLISTKGERLELDFYLERLGIAVEVQGKQHFEFTPIFHASEWDFQEQLRRDKDKLEVCQRAGIDLLYVYRRSDVELVLTACYDAVGPNCQDDRNFIRTDSIKNHWNERPIKLRSVNNIERAMLGVLNYGKMAERQDCFKHHHVVRALSFYLFVKAYIDKGNCFTKSKYARGFYYLESFLSRERLV